MGISVWFSRFSPLFLSLPVIAFLVRHHICQTFYTSRLLNKKLLPEACKPTLYDKICVHTQAEERQRWFLHSQPACLTKESARLETVMKSTYITSKQSVHNNAIQKNCFFHTLFQGHSLPNFLCKL